MSERKPPKWVAPLPGGHHLDGVAPRYGIAQKFIDKSAAKPTQAADMVRPTSPDTAGRAVPPKGAMPGTSRGGPLATAPEARRGAVPAPTGARGPQLPPLPVPRPASVTRASLPPQPSFPGANATRPPGARPPVDSVQGRRERLVRDLAARGLQDLAVLDALRTVPRDAFVDPALASRAYDDTALPIGHEQTISQPFTVGRMLELMRQGRPPGQRLARVLEVGTGCGYQAAVLGQIADMVFSIERIRALHELARSNLRPLRLANVRLHFGDGRVGLPHEGPFDGIVVAAAGFELPQELLDQLRVGGRLVAPVARGDGRQRLVVIDRTGRADWQRAEADDVHFVPLRSGTT